MLNKDGRALLEERKTLINQANGVASAEQNSGEDEGASGSTGMGLQKRQQEEADRQLALAIAKQEMSAAQPPEEAQGVVAREEVQPPVNQPEGIRRRTVLQQQAVPVQPQQPAVQQQIAPVQPQQPGQAPVHERFIRRALEFLAPVCRIL